MCDTETCKYYGDQKIRNLQIFRWSKNYLIKNYLAFNCACLNHSQTLVYNKASIFRDINKGYFALTEDAKISLLKLPGIL